jgi:hypothetical protein
MAFRALPLLIGQRSDPQLTHQFGGRIAGRTEPPLQFLCSPDPNHETYHMRWMRLVTPLVFSFLAAPALASHDLYTGHSLTGGSTEETFCMITNVSSKPIEVTAEILDSSNRFSGYGSDGGYAQLLRLLSSLVTHARASCPTSTRTRSSTATLRPRAARSELACSRSLRTLRQEPASRRRSESSDGPSPNVLRLANAAAARVCPGVRAERGRTGRPWEPGLLAPLESRRSGFMVRLGLR